MKTFAYSIIFTLLLLLSFEGKAQDLPPILLNETYEEWAEILDIANESESGNTTIKAINTDNQLFLYFETSDVLSIQNQGRIILYLDTDNDAATGTVVNGIGAEVQVDFGNRTVTVVLNGETSTVGFRDIDLNIMPTVWSDKFEIAINREAKVNDIALFSSSEVKLTIEDQASGKFSPSMSGGASYTFADFVFDPLPTYSIEKTDVGHLRVISHNVLRDALFDESAKDHFRSMYQAIDPDIIGFQEIYDHSAEEIAAIVEEFLPSAEGETWFSSSVHDNTVVSRFPIKSTHEANVFGNGAWLLNLNPTYQTELLLINAHTPCCNNDAGRADEIDAMMAFVRDAKAGVDELTLKENTPIMLMGDMNLVGDPQNMRTLLDGDIQNEGTWGSGFTPDWNGEDFIDVQPIVTGLPMTFTHWSNTGLGNFSSGRLDAIVYSGSGLTLENSYVLYTLSMEENDLTTYSMEAGDAEGASDHLPLVADFTVTAVQEIDLGMLELRENDLDGLPAHLGETVTVAGVITVDEAFGDNNAFMQNDDAGIALFGNEFGALFTVGDSVEVTGNVGEFQGQTQLVYDSETSGVTFLKTAELPAPVIISISEVLDQDWNGFELLEGMLVQVIGANVTESGNFEGNTTYEISNAGLTMNLRIGGNTDIPGSSIPDGAVTITGTLGQFDTDVPYSEGYQIIPRSMDDLEEAAEGILALRQNNVDGEPILDGSLVAVSGVITVSDEFGANGPGFLQDNTAGVSLFGSDLIDNLEKGDSVTITTTVGFFNGLTQLTYDASSTVIDVHKSAEVPDPLTITISEILDQEWDDFELHESMLLAIENIEFEETGLFSGNTNYTISDGENSLAVRIDSDTDIAGHNIPSESGTIVGILSQFDGSAPYSTGYQLLPRSVDDINYEEPAPLSINNEGDLIVYPNPATDHIFIRLVEDTKAASISIIDLIGQEVLSRELSSFSSSVPISISELPEGIYVCRAIWNNKEVIKKFVVTKN